MFKAFFAKNVFPVVKADDEDIEDPQQTLRDECSATPHCKHLAEVYQECNDRVNSKSKTAETCTMELFDLLHAMDHCVTPKLFSKLK